MNQKITQIDRDTALSLQDELAGELFFFCKQRGLTLQFHRGMLNRGGSVTMKLELACKGKNGIVHTSEYQSLLDMCSIRKGCTNRWLISDFEQPFTSRGKQYRVIGWRDRASSKPFIIQDAQSGQRYVCGEAMVARGYSKDVGLYEYENPAAGPLGD